MDNPVSRPWRLPLPLFTSKQAQMLGQGGAVLLGILILKVGGVELGTEGGAAMAAVLIALFDAFLGGRDMPDPEAIKRQAAELVERSTEADRAVIAERIRGL